MDVPSGKVWPLEQEMVQLVELHDSFELCGWTGRVKQSFFSCSQYGPMKFSGQEHVPGSMQMPLFLHGGIQIAGKKCIEIWFAFDQSEKKLIRSHASLSVQSSFSKTHSPLLQIILAIVSPLGN